MTTTAVRASSFAISYGMSIKQDKNLLCGFILDLYITSLSQEEEKLFVFAFRCNVDGILYVLLACER